jgi:hypothetical protein
MGSHIEKTTGEGREHSAAGGERGESPRLSATQARELLTSQLGEGRESSAAGGERGESPPPSAERAGALLASQLGEGLMEQAASIRGGEASADRSEPSLQVGAEASEDKRDIPSHIDVLPDGREAVVSGDPQGDALYNHQQGDNADGFQSDCGLVSCQDILNQYGKPVTENDVVGFAVAHNLCDTSATDPSENGGTSVSDQATILTDEGVRAHAETNNTLDGLATDIEQGHGVIIEANAGVLWGDASFYGDGSPNHAVVVTGVARDPSTDQVLGFYINDSGNYDGGKGSARFVDAATMRSAWADVGGMDVVTDATRMH